MSDYFYVFHPGWSPNYQPPGKPVPDDVVDITSNVNELNKWERVEIDCYTLATCKSYEEALQWVKQYGYRMFDEYKG